MCSLLKSHCCTDQPFSAHLFLQLETDVAASREKREARAAESSRVGPPFAELATLRKKVRLLNALITQPICLHCASSPCYQLKAQENQTESVRADNKALLAECSDLSALAALVEKRARALETNNQKLIEKSDQLLHVSHFHISNS